MAALDHQHRRCDNDVVGSMAAIFEANIRKSQSHGGLDCKSFLTSIAGGDGGRGQIMRQRSLRQPQSQKLKDDCDSKARSKDVSHNGCNDNSKTRFHNSWGAAGNNDYNDEDYDDYDDGNDECCDATNSTSTVPTLSSDDEDDDDVRPSNQSSSPQHVRYIRRQQRSKSAVYCRYNMQEKSHSSSSEIATDVEKVAQKTRDRINYLVRQRRHSVCFSSMPKQKKIPSPSPSSDKEAAAMDVATKTDQQNSRQRINHLVCQGRRYSDQDPEAKLSTTCLSLPRNGTVATDTNGNDSNSNENTAANNTASPSPESPILLSPSLRDPPRTTISTAATEERWGGRPQTRRSKSMNYSTTTTTSSSSSSNSRQQYKSTSRCRSEEIPLSRLVVGSQKKEQQHQQQRCSDDGDDNVQPSNQPLSLHVRYNRRQERSKSAVYCRCSVLEKSHPSSEAPMDVAKTAQKTRERINNLVRQRRHNSIRSLQNHSTQEQRSQSCHARWKLRKERRLAAAIRIQAVVRTHTARKRFQQWMAAARTIQSTARCQHQKTHYQKNRAARTIQSFYRTQLERLQNRVVETQERLAQIEWRTKYDLALIQAMNAFRRRQELKEEEKIIRSLEQENAELCEQSKQIAQDLNRPENINNSDQTKVEAVAAATATRQGSNHHHQTTALLVEILVEKNKKSEKRAKKLAAQIELLNAKIACETNVKESFQNGIAAVVERLENNCNDEHLIDHVVALSMGEFKPQDDDFDNSSNDVNNENNGKTNRASSSDDEEDGLFITIHRSDDASVFSEMTSHEIEEEDFSTTHHWHHDNDDGNSNSSYEEVPIEKEKEEEEDAESAELSRESLEIIIIEEEIEEEDSPDVISSSSSSSFDDDFSCDSSAYVERSSIIL